MDGRVGGRDEGDDGDEGDAVVDGVTVSGVLRRTEPWVSVCVFGAVA